MTAEQLRARDGMISMCESDNFRVLLAFFMESCPWVGSNIADPTSIVRNEGRMQGHFELLNKMRTIHRSEKPTAPLERAGGIYPDPDKQTELNRPKQ